MVRRTGIKKRLLIGSSTGFLSHDVGLKYFSVYVIIKEILMKEPARILPLIAFWSSTFYSYVFILSLLRKSTRLVP